MQEYNQADIWLHQASQYLALINQTYQEQKADDSHTALHFDPINQFISGHWIHTDQGSYLPTLNLDRLRLQWVNSALEVVGSIELQKPFASSLLQSYVDLLPSLPKATIPEAMHYEIPIYDPVDSPSASSLEIWQRYRGIALHASYSIIRLMNVDARVHLWPHHFDTGIYIPIKGSQGIGFGLAMADSLNIGPYFYMASYNENGMINPRELKKVEVNQGSWIKEGDWTGSVMRLKLLETSKDAADLLNHWVNKSLYSFLSFQ